MNAQEIAAKAAELTGGDRARQHGADKTANHQNIADLWNAFLRGRMILGALLSSQDVALMMALLKIARTKMGTHNVDDYVDGAGYMAVAGEIAEFAADPPKLPTLKGKRP